MGTEEKEERLRENCSVTVLHSFVLGAFHMQLSKVMCTGSVVVGNTHIHTETHTQKVVYNGTKNAQRCLTNKYYSLLNGKLVLIYTYLVIYSCRLNTQRHLDNAFCRK